MYISGQRDTGRRRTEEIKIPEQYSGNAFPTDTEALAIAEEAFRRGYVFDNAESRETVEDGIAENVENTDNVEKSAANTDADFTDKIEVKETMGDAVAVHKRQGGLPGILDRLTTENIILIALILILWDSKADDELLLMLVILFFC